MKKHEAEKLVNDTFTQTYDEERFRLFVHNLFQDYESLNEKALSGTYIPEAFKDGILSYKRLAKFLDPEGLEVDVLAVKVPSRRTLENARTMQRNFIARYLNGSRGGTLKDAALVAFYSDDCEDWRFSLVRMDYILDEEKKKVRKELTPARRYSFLVGKHEKTHTARRQLLPVLQSETETTLAELEAAFNIETVTKEFFEKYKSLYLGLKETLEKHLEQDTRTKAEFETKAIKTDDFAKRLLGQIVFLYFLQKKGWLGVTKGKEWGTGPKDFLQALYRGEYGEYRNFFNDVLEPLFYEALATERHDNYYDHLKCRIPFLNGGLFEAIRNYDWVNTDILLDNAIFKEIFEVFDLYNFTVREDEPLDKEVAVDPEMLGKVFENLIPENERKGSGTYYTPREIVHYMCQESLINYLDAKLNIESRPIEERGQQSLLPDFASTDLLTKYKDVYVPVVPREDIAEFIYHGDVAQEHDATAEVKNQREDYKGTYQHKIPESVRKYAQQIDNALAHVKICDPAIGSGAFPVGVMNEIVRARGALTAYLGSDGRTPYDFKRHAIQESIYGVDLEPSAVDIAKLRLWLSLVVDEDDFGTIKPLPNLDYKIMAGDSLLGIDTKGDMIRAQQLSELERLKAEYFSATSPSRKAEIKNCVDAIIGDLTSIHTKAQGLQQNARFDYRVYFSEIFGNSGGFNIVIGNPPYVDSEIMVKNMPEFREAVAKDYKTAKGNWDLYIPFWEVGCRLCANNGTLTLITPNKWLAIGYGKSLREFIKKEIYKLSDYSSFRAFEQVGVFPVVAFVQKNSLHKDVAIEIFSSLTSKSYEGTVPQDLVCNLDNWGVLTSKNIELIRKMIASRDLLGSLCELSEPFTVSEAYELVDLISNTPEESLDYFKFINTGTIDPYVSLWGQKTTTYLKNKFQYPQIEKARLQSKFPRRFVQSSKTKIIFSGMRHFEAFFDEEGEYVAGKSTAIATDIKIDPYFLLGLLNSKIIRFFFKEAYGALGMDGGINFSPSNICKIPVPSDKEKNANEIGVLSRGILKSSDETGSQNLKNKIDHLVYQLYGLTAEEIAIVEETVQ